MKRQRNQSLILLFTSLALLIVLVSGTWNTAYGAGLDSQRPVPAQKAANWVIPTFSIVSVNPDVSVTIQTYNFPANDTFDVLMNYMHTQGVGGYYVQSVNSGAGGSLTWTFNIPSQLKGQYQIAIRLQSPYSGYYAYNWFYNNTSGGIPPTGSTPVPPPPPPGVIPTFSITAVVRDSTVTITTANFPANDNFDVLMNYMHTQGVGGYYVQTINSGSGGTQTWTFNIPSQLYGQYQIAIRLQSPTSGYFAYNWFYNNTTGGIPPTGSTATPIPSLPPGVIPTFTIQSVVRDSTVTIKTANFPANDNFDVLMNYMGTKGVGGYYVQTVNSGSGGTQTWTFNIPSQLYGQYQIAIRLQSPTSGYYSYNWFYNNTTP
jgi:hypothetical protein